MEHKFLNCLQVFHIFILWSGVDCQHREVFFSDGITLHLKVADTQNTQSSNQIKEAFERFVNFSEYALSSTVSVKPLRKKSKYNLYPVSLSYFPIEEWDDVFDAFGKEFSADIPDEHNINHVENWMFELLHNWNRSKNIGPLRIDSIRSSEICPSRTTLSSSGLPLVWSFTEKGFASSTNICPADDMPFAYCSCDGSTSTGYGWGDVKEHDCSYVGQSSTMTLSLEELSKEDVNETNSENVTNSLKRLTDTNLLVENDVIYSSIVLDKVSSQPNLGVNVVDDFVYSVNNLLRVGKSILQKADKIGQSSSRILKSLDRVGRNAYLGEDTSRLFAESKIAVQLVDVDDDNEFYGIGLLSKFENISKMALVNYTDDKADIEDTQASVILSREAIKYARSSLSKSSVSDKVRIAFMIIEDGFFEVYDKSSQYALHGSVSSYIVSATTYQTPIKDVKDAVRISLMANNKEDNVHACGSWVSFQGTKYWSRQGCETELDKHNQVVCHCNHLTKFAILLVSSADPTDHSADPTDHSIIDYSIVGGIAIFCFLIIIVVLVKKLIAKMIKHKKREQVFDKIKRIDGKKKKTKQNKTKSLPNITIYQTSK